MSERSSTGSRRDAILQAALGCFVAHGVEATTIEMIRAASGASTGSLYHHFGNKERIAAAVYLEGLRRFRVLQAAYFESATTLEAGIRALVHAQVDWIAAEPEWARYLFNHRGVLAQAGLEASQRESLQESVAKAGEWFTARLPAGQRLRWPPEAYVALLVGPVHEYARHWLAGQRELPLTDLREFFADAACRAVGLPGEIAPGLARG